MDELEFEFDFCKVNEFEFEFSFFKIKKKWMDPTLVLLRSFWSDMIKAYPLCNINGYMLYTRLDWIWICSQVIDEFEFEFYKVNEFDFNLSKVNDFEFEHLN